MTNPPSSPTTTSPTDILGVDHSPRAARGFPCTQCGARLTYEPGTVDLTCEYCGAANHIPQSQEEIEELDFMAYLKRVEEAGDPMVAQQTVREVACGTCGAVIEPPRDMSAFDCPYCGRDIVAQPTEKRAIRPRSLLPFVIDRKQGQSLFQSWVASRWFAPNTFRKRAMLDGKLTGLYVPYWTYDSDTTSHYTGQRGEHYWDTEHYTAFENGKHVRKTRRVRKTRWYPASGVVWVSFDDVLVLASRNLPRSYANKLEPWDLSNLIPYQDEYLSGFFAETYQVQLDEGFGVAQQVMDDGIRAAVRRDIGGDEQRIHDVRTQHDNVTFKHILLPIWLSSYTYQDKVYRFLINARTGEVQGQRPWSFWKIALAVLAALTVAGLGAAIFAVANQ